MRKLNLADVQYKTPLTLDEQYELLGELWSARVRIKRLEAGRVELTKLIQELLKETKKKKYYEREEYYQQAR
jgi:hypothetical protein